MTRAIGYTHGVSGGPTQGRQWRGLAAKLASQSQHSGKLPAKEDSPLLNAFASSEKKLVPIRAGDHAAKFCPIFVHNPRIG